MEDVGRASTDLSPVQTEPASIPTLDGWIESLMTCKQLAEVDVQRLCDKVIVFPALDSLLVVDMPILCFLHHVPLEGGNPLAQV